MLSKGGLSFNSLEGEGTAVLETDGLFPLLRENIY